MAPLLNITGAFAFLALLPGMASASMHLEGVYRGEIGQLELQTRPGGRVTGHYAAGGPCNFDPQRPVLEGEFEGKVLVASVTLCQTGPACEERPYNILAFYDPSSKALVADVKLDAGCDSPALVHSRLLLHLAKPEEILPPAHLPVGKKGKRQEACRNALGRGWVLMGRQDYPGAAFYFGQGLACEPKNWLAHFAIGVAELRRSNVAEAMTSLNQAKVLMEKQPEDVRGTYERDVYYNLACAYVRQGDQVAAFANLRRAVELGFVDMDAVNTDPDLQPLRGAREFKAIQDLISDHKERKQREPNKKGEP